MAAAKVARTARSLRRLDPELAELVQLIPEWDPWAQHRPGEYFDPEAARHALEWIPEWLKFHKGPKAGEPFELDDWQRAIVAIVWGFRLADGSRRFNTVFLYVAKKNGKSAFTAALILYFLATEGGNGMELYSLASSQKQANNVFKHAAGMVKLQPAFLGRWRILGNKGGTVTKSITDEESLSSYQVLCADPDTVDGFEPDMAVVDELHRHRTGELMDVVRRSGRSNPRHLTIITTTADHNRESACNDELRRARLIRENTGQADEPGYAPRYAPCIWEADREKALEIDDDGVAGWEKPEIWAQANPGLGTIKPIETLEEGVQEVKDQPSKLNNFLRLDLNIVTDTAEAWLDPGQWDACEPRRTVKQAAKHILQLREDLEGEPCWAGVDLSRKIDQTAAVLWFPDHEVVLSWHWMPRDRARLVEHRHGIPYSLWEREGLIEICDGGVVNYKDVEAKLMELTDLYDIQDVGYDPWKFERIRQNVLTADIEVELTQMAQGAKTLGEATAELEGLVVEGRLKHGCHPVLKQNARNASIRIDANTNIIPCKKRSSGPIDGILALVMALAGAILEPAGPSLGDYLDSGEILEI